MSAVSADSGRSPRRILLSGASGLVGKALCAALAEAGWEVVRLVRRPAGPGEVTWNPAASRVDLAGIGVVEAVVHLSGESVSRRWTQATRAEISYSRANSTDILARGLAEMPIPPRVFVSASAVGWYGDRGDELLTEVSRGGATGFLPEVCGEWEGATMPASEAGIRTVNLRIGVVLSANGGALPNLLGPVRFGLGAVVGTGDQFFPWIALDDLVALIIWSLDAELAGPVNATAPDPVTNRVLMETLGRVCGRPVLFRVPGWFIGLALGDMGRELLVGGQRAVPAKALAGGFRFAHPDLEAALRREAQGGAVAKQR